MMRSSPAPSSATVACASRPAIVEVVLRAAQIAEPFFARRRDELDRAPRAPVATPSISSAMREHHRQPATVVVDAGADQPLAVAPHASDVPRGNTVSRCAQMTIGREVRSPGRRPMTLPASSVCTSPSQRAESATRRTPPRSCSSPVGAAICASVICECTIASSREANRARAAASARCVATLSTGVRCARAGPCEDMLHLNRASYRDASGRFRDSPDETIREMNRPPPRLSRNVYALTRRELLHRRVERDDLSAPPGVPHARRSARARASSARSRAPPNRPPRC